MPRLTILIPCVGGAAEFDATLVSVLQHRPDDCEIVLLHTEPYDDPYQLRGEVQFLQACRSAQQAELINEGLATAVGEFVHILGCGLEVTEGWTEPALSRFVDDDVAAVSPLVVNADQSRLVSAGIHWTLGGSRRVVADQRLMLSGSARLRAGILGPTLSAGFYRHEVLAALGGVDAGLDQRYADVDLALAIAALDLRTLCEPASRIVQTADQATERCGAFSRGRSAERVFWRYARQRGMAISAIMHSLAPGGDFLATQSVLATAAVCFGRMLALLEVGSVTRHEERIATARERLTKTEERATIPLLQPPATRPAPASSKKAQRRAA